MGIRETYGPIVEEALANWVDSNLKPDELKEKLNEMVNKLVDEKLQNLKDYLINDLIDQIDGVDNRN